MSVFLSRAPSDPFNRHIELIHESDQQIRHRRFIHVSKMPPTRQAAGATAVIIVSLTDDVEKVRCAGASSAAAVCFACGGARCAQAAPRSSRTRLKSIAKWGFLFTFARSIFYRKPYYNRFLGKKAAPVEFYSKQDQYSGMP